MRFRVVVGFISGIALLSGCQGIDINNAASFGDAASTVGPIVKTKYYPNDQLIGQGKRQFSEGHYGKSYSLFKKAVEVYPKDPQAWLGYAASADHLRRFKNADIGYRKLSRMIPKRPEYLNNVGYSYLLRGNLQLARRYFLRAYEIDPENETTANNLEMLRNSTKFVKRG